MPSPHHISRTDWIIAVCTLLMACTGIVALAYAHWQLKQDHGPDAEYHLLDFFETVGDLTDKGYLDEADVWENFAGDVEPLYSDTRDMIEQQRDPTFYNDFVALARKMQSLEKSNGGDPTPYSKEELRGYLARRKRDYRWRSGSASQKGKAR